MRFGEICEKRLHKGMGEWGEFGRAEGLREGMWRRLEFRGMAC